ncbi:MAG: DUF1573 domain-containing protein [Bacteroidota bacterium]
MKKTTYLHHTLLIGFVLSFVFACQPENEASTDASQTSTAVNPATSVSNDNSAPVSQVEAPADSEEEKPNENGPKPVIEFEEYLHDFGQINEGDVVEHTFAFKNIGEVPLVIDRTTASCGCTVPSKPDEPIAPGKTGEIQVEFNSAGKSGSVNKTVRIFANTVPAVTTLTIKGEIKSKPAIQGPYKK